MAEANANVDPNSSTGLDRLFNRMKSDLMYELRNIQHGERPVTGQNNKEKIGKFLTRHFPSDGEKEQPPSDEEDHRPETVVMEVQGIIENRPVSSILQSASFRRQLENVIRGSIGSAQRSPLNLSRSGTTSRGGTPDSVRSTGRFAQQRNQDRRSPVNRTTAASRAAAPEPTPVPRPRTSIPAPPADIAGSSRETQRAPAILSRSSSADSVDSFSSARSSVDIDEDFEDVEESPRASPVRVPPTHRQPPTTHRAPPAPPAHRETQRTEGTFPHISLGDIREVQQQELVEEISELLHHRLVSSALDSQFRARLELHIQDRVSASGTNGSEVQNFIQSLPPSGILRNDFTDLGIPSAQDLDNLDNISVTNVSAHSVPYTQSHTHMSREIQSLKAQMSEMKNMLKLTFDLQMDIQRAIRQEVAAAMSQVAGAAVNATVNTPASSKPVSDTHCLICLERHSDCVLYQCGHMCVCYMCGRDLVSRNLGCPVCRAPIKDVIRAYKTNVD